MRSARAEKIAPRWLKLRDAVAYSAIGENRIVQMAEAGRIVGFRDPDSGRNDWIFDRDSIDAYREAQAAGSGGAEVDLVVAKILAKRSRRGK